MAALYDPTDPALQDDPYSVYRVLRDDYPVYHNEEMGFWALSRFEDVLAATRDVETFANDPRHIREYPETLNALLPASALNFGLFYMDPPAHNPTRALISQAFTPKRIAALEPRIRALSRSLLAPLRDADRFEFVSAFASPLPVAIIGELLGIPEQHRDEVRALWTRIVARPGDRTTSDVAADVRNAIDEMFELFRGVRAGATSRAA